MYKTVQLNCFRKVFCTTAFPCVSTSSPLTYMWAFGFVGCILFSISLLRRGAVPTRRHKTQPFRTKWSSIAKNCGKIAILSVPRQPFRTKQGSIAKNSNKIMILKCPRQPFRTKWGSIAKNCGKIAIFTGPAQPFRTTWSLIVGNWGRMVPLCVKSVCV